MVHDSYTLRGLLVGNMADRKNTPRFLPDDVAKAAELLAVELHLRRKVLPPDRFIVVLEFLVEGFASGEIHPFLPAEIRSGIFDSLLGVDGLPAGRIQ